VPERPLSDREWEGAWAPYDDATYRAALLFIQPDDVVLDIGAGDLRFARRAAQRARQVIAIEQRLDLLTSPYPPNLLALCGDARRTPFPRGITVGVLLMRHCQHFAMYARKLRAVGCRRLVTNARWGMDVEAVALAPQPPFDSAATGWYACLCGAVGFKPNVPEQLDDAALNTVAQVESCPACAEADDRGRITYVSSFVI